MSAYQSLCQLFEQLHDLNHLHAIANWDEAVMMPAGGGTQRAKALATLDVISHDMLTNQNTGKLIALAQDDITDDPWQQQNYYWMTTQYRRATCLPSQLVAKLTETALRCEQAWRNYRAENNWNDFAPLFNELITLIKQKADRYSQTFECSPYNALIQEYCPGFSTSTIDPIFNRLKECIPTLLRSTIAKQTKATSLSGTFDCQQQQQLGHNIMAILGFDFNRGRLDVSHHPFCGGNPTDVRITTRYDINDFMSGAMAVCHETGHARFEQGLPRQWLTQPVGHIHSMALHESQSLLVEMQACRTPEFMSVLSQLACEQFGQQQALSADNLYRLATYVQPGYIRVDADEVTYPLHIILRYDIEKALIEQQLAVNELPDIWHSHMQTLLGLSTQGNFKDGVMQDVHWPSGAFGYFPGYTLGAMIAAQLFQALKTSQPNLLTDIGQGQFHGLFDWLSQHVHSRASSVTTEQLLLDATGETLNPDYFLAHLKNRY